MTKLSAAEPSTLPARGGTITGECMEALNHTGEEIKPRRHRRHRESCEDSPGSLWECQDPCQRARRAFPAKASGVRIRFRNSVIARVLPPGCAVRDQVPWPWRSPALIRSRKE